MLLFAQWHFVTFLAILILMVAFETVFAISLSNDTDNCKSLRQRHKQRKLNHIVLRRFTVLMIFVFTAIPCTVILFSHGLSSPTYQADQEILSAVLNVENESISDEGIYEKNIQLLLCFREDSWKRYSIQEKTTFMQALADMEAEILGIPSVPLTTEKLSAFTLGEYRGESNTISCDIEHIAKSSAENCINTICHEITHSWQRFLVDNIDWDAEISKNPYFDQVRAWKDNQEHYIQPAGTTFSSYESQPVEASARIYAEEETARILSYIEAKDISSEDSR